MKIHKNPFAFLLLVSLGIACIGAVKSDEIKPPDGQHVPLVVAPDSSDIDANQAVPIVVSISGVTTNNQTVNISSSSSSLVVPPTVVVPAGYDSVAFYGLGHDFPDGPLNSGGVAPTSTPVTITASCNGGSAYGYVNVNE